MGRELSCNRRMGRAFGFPDQDTREDRAGPQNCAALLRKAWPGGNDLRAPRRGDGQDVTELNPAAHFPLEQVVRIPSHFSPDLNYSKLDYLISIVWFTTIKLVTPLYSIRR